MTNLQINTIRQQQAHNSSAELVIIEWKGDGVISHYEVGIKEGTRLLHVKEYDNYNSANKDFKSRLEDFKLYDGLPLICKKI